MAHYMAQAAYTAEFWKALTQNPVDRSAVVSAQLQKLGGRLVSFYFSFGEYDAVAIYEAPSEIGAAAFAFSVVAPGFLKAFKTTPLLTVQEAMQAMQQAGAAPYPALATR